MTLTRRKPAVKNQTFQLVVLGVLIVVATVVGFMQLGGSSPAAAHASTTVVNSQSAKSSTSASSSVPADLTVTWPVRIERDVFTWNHDVIQTRPQPVVAGPNQNAIEREARASIRLQAIMLDGRPRILANGRILVKGEEIEGFTLKEINHRHIVLEKMGVQVLMSL